MYKHIVLLILIPACVPQSPDDQSTNSLSISPGPPTTGTTAAATSWSRLPLFLSSLGNDSGRVSSTHEIRARWGTPGGSVPTLPAGTYIRRSFDHGQTWTRLADATATSGYYDDHNARPNASNCYQLMNDSTGDSSQINCAYTLDGVGHAPARIQLRIAVPPTAGADTTGHVRVRLQTNNYHDPNPLDTYTIPTGNETWLDSHENDFSRGSSHTYDLMHDNIQDLSDITDIYIEVFGGDDLCVSEVELLVDVDHSSNNRQLYYQNFGSICSQSVGNVTVKADALDGSNRLIHIPFESLRAQQWTRYQNDWSAYTGPHFGGYTNTDWTAMIEAIFGSSLVATGHGWIESAFQSWTLDQTRQHHLAYIGYEDGGTVHCTLPFDVLINQQCNASGQVVSAGTAISAGNPDCNLVWWQRGLVYVLGGVAVGAVADSVIAHEINLIASKALTSMSAQAAGSLPVPPAGTHFAFIPASSIPLTQGYFNGFTLMSNDYAGYCNVTPPPSCVPKCDSGCGLPDGCGHRCGCGGSQKCCGEQCIASAQKCIPK